MRRLLDALAVLATCQKSSLIPLHPSIHLNASSSHYLRDHDESKISHNHINSYNSNNNSSTTESSSTSSSSGRGRPVSQSSMGGPWTFYDRIVVLAGLCEVLKASAGVADVFTKVTRDSTAQKYSGHGDVRVTAMLDSARFGDLKNLSWPNIDVIRILPCNETVSCRHFFIPPYSSLLLITPYSSLLSTTSLYRSFPFFLTPIQPNSAFSGLQPSSL